MAFRVPCVFFPYTFLYVLVLGVLGVLVVLCCGLSILRIFHELRVLVAHAFVRMLFVL